MLARKHVFRKIEHSVEFIVLLVLAAVILLRLLGWFGSDRLTLVSTLAHLS